MGELTSSGRISKSACPSWELNIGSLRPNTRKPTEKRKRRIGNYKKHPQQNHREGRQRLVKQIRRSFVGLSNGVQDADRYDPLSIRLWKSLPPSGGVEHKAYWAIKEMNLDLDAAVVK
jgi:hypothetical protein